MPDVMSTTAEAEQLGDAEFRWGKRRISDGKKKEVEYESFSYDGIEYQLYDCVYMHKEDEPKPYIGKLIKIWECPEKSKKVKVQWFFWPSEISNWLEHHKLDTRENEIFFASGEGLGLANINPLEAIAGKCNVVCISIDSRNPHPSEEQLQMADYVFYRTFDVGSCTVSDIMGDKVGGLEVNFVFNRKESEMASDPKLISGQKQDGGRINIEKDHTDSIVNTISNKVKDSGLQAKAKQRIKSEKGPLESEDPDGMGARPSKRAKLDAPSRLTNGKDVMKGGKSNATEKEVLNITASEEKTKSGRKEFVGMAKDKRIAEHSGALDGKPSKKSKVQQFENSPVPNKVTKNPTSTDKIASKEMPNEKDKANKSSIRLDGPPSETHKRKTTKSLTLGKGLSKEKPNDKTCELRNHPLVMDKGKSISEENLERKLPMLVSNNLTKISEASVDAEEKIEGKIYGVTRKPDAEKGKWFTSLPWEQRMQSAYEKRTLVLLQNLDPDYTSGEVEDIVWSAFKENCEAKVVQRTAFSSPYSGQAFVIFKTREAAERVIRKLSDGCLILPNKRPLVGCMAVLPKFTGKQSTFVGHLVIDKIKLQMPREMKDALSTSHCSQSNTIEYDLAMEWCLLQSRFDISWQALYKQQGEDLKRLMASFKSN